MDPILIASISTVIVLIVTVLFFRCRAPRSTPKRVRSSTFVLAGAPSTGKTALLNALVFSRVPETVTSVRETSLTVVLSAHASQGTSAPRVTLVDCPGSAHARAFLPRAAAQAAAVVLVVDAAGGAPGVAAAADVLFDLLTSASVVDAAPDLLIAANKSDCAGATAPAKLLAALEAELTRLCAARSALRTQEDTRTARPENGSVPLKLGGSGTFLFSNAPLRTTCVATTAIPGGVPSCSKPIKVSPAGVAGVVAFIDATLLAA